MRVGCVTCRSLSYSSFELGFVCRYCWPMLVCSVSTEILMEQGRSVRRSEFLNKASNPMSIKHATTDYIKTICRDVLNGRYFAIN